MFWILVLLLSGLTPAISQVTGAVDLSFSDEAGETSVQKESYSRRFLPGRIRGLKAEQEMLRKQISALPQHTPKPLSDRRGYHSVPIEIPSDDVQRIDIQFAFHSKLDSIALMPALVAADTGLESYAFPKRFKIEVLENRGVWIGGDPGRWEERPDEAEWVEVVNWMNRDFPDPGPYPVFFECSGQKVYQVRISFPKGSAASMGDFHALGELYLFRRDMKERMSDNMMGWGADVKVNASNSLSKPPLWDVQYLKDGFAGLGLPLSEEIAAVDDLMIYWDDGEPCAPVEIMLDLGEVRQVGGLHIWPAEAPHGMEVPLFGFPGKVKVEFSADRNFKEVRMAEVSNARQQMYRDNLLIMATRAYEARYVRVTLDDFTMYQNRKILGLGEIRVGEYNTVWSTGCAISGTGLPEWALDQLPRLVDGFSRGRRILSESERIKGLAMRRPLDMRLKEVERELVLAENAWRVLQLRLSIAGGVLLLLVLFLVWRSQQRKRKKELSTLRQRITRDLHDDVGSSLGGISLMSTKLETMAVNQTVKEELGGLALMAREACSSLREVVWLTDQEVILLPALLEKMMERAQRTLYGMDLTVDIGSNIPEVEVGWNVKRHLIMFFREAIHNCARHSNADRAEISVCADNVELQISIRDYGCGFDPAEKNKGWGLESMKKRGEELGGDVSLISALGEGTSVILRVPLSKLSKEPAKAYKTSN
ncbi:Sensor histidine kinase LiaS [Pontiella desulfatans]|uniref:Sensor histidine kinase LiaS n=1 Tax=Pontiella desulfatans TaxID=2750659 RepID=A0A6C2TWF2_PONDE|nr:ATP-binding protein [Pontiella desulfatans]VGO12005.1 Sensor histidine kinase LiaS [Pontiella desulfatans]